mgnify:CR=1 FL=1
MTSSTQEFPVFVMCGRDPQKRRLLLSVDPDGEYKSKALLPFLGKRLIEWQLEELKESPFVEGLYLLGLTEEDVSFDYPVAYVPVASTAGFGEKLVQGLDYLQTQGIGPELVVISSCDAPGIRLQEINTFSQMVRDDPGKDFYLSLVPEEVAEAVFPRSGRAVARFKDCDVFPGELYALSPKAIRELKRVIEDLGMTRRKINRQAQKISLGPMLMYIGRRPRTWILILKYLLGLATLEDGERILSAAFGIKIRGLIIPEAGFGMDMDLPEDYERLKDYVRRTKLTPEEG